MHIIIMGAGITGLTSALALRKHLPDPKPKLTVVEIRPTPSTIGGAVNLTPKALRYLDYLGLYSGMVSKGAGAECKTIELFDIYSGTRISEVDFRGADGDGIGKEQNKKFFARRVMRWQLQEALLDAVKAQKDTSILWGKKVVKIEEPHPGQGAHMTFEDGDEMKCDLLLGCDGIHSATRSLLVEPSREPTYTGIAVVMATSKIRPGTKLHWDVTGLTSSQRGSFMASYFEPTRKDQYIAVVMEIAEMLNREGWKIRGSDQNAIKAEILERFKCDTMPELAELAEDAGEWTLYPTHKLSPKGQWTSNPGQTCILLGDAAHAVS
jgi:2-polyprenyl-6-methoxyphenol hydroxylase-like FAD-dependent oxidoreductase